jgi:hypothetical protein
MPCHVEYHEAHASTVTPELLGIQEGHQINLKKRSKINKRLRKKYGELGSLKNSQFLLSSLQYLHCDWYRLFDIIRRNIAPVIKNMYKIYVGQSSETF